MGWVSEWIEMIKRNSQWFEVVVMDGSKRIEVEYQNELR